MQHNVITIEEAGAAVKEKMREILLAAAKQKPADSYPSTTNITEEIDAEIEYCSKRLIKKTRIIVLQLIDAITNHEGDQPFRLLEVGCGSSFEFALLAEIVAAKSGKKIEYVGIDIDAYDIKINIQMSKGHLLSSTFICHDASDIAWFQSDAVKNRRFNALLMINPIVENPFKAAIDSKLRGGVDESDLEYYKDEVKMNPNFQRLYMQYNSFKKIFREVLPVCLAPNADLLVSVFHPIEYKGLLKLAQPLVSDVLPPYENAQEVHFSVASKYKPVCQPQHISSKKLNC